MIVGPSLLGAGNLPLRSPGIKPDDKEETPFKPACPSGLLPVEKNADRRAISVQPFLNDQIAIPGFTMRAVQDLMASHKLPSPRITINTIAEQAKLFLEDCETGRCWAAANGLAPNDAEDGKEQNEQGSSEKSQMPCFSILARQPLGDSTSELVRAVFRFCYCSQSSRRPYPRPL
jgi:hypothetical protein